MMGIPFFFSPGRVFRCVAVATLLLAGTGAWEGAQAQPQPVPPPQQCTNNQFGFVTRIFTCVQYRTTAAVHEYVDKLHTVLLPYLGATITLAVVLFGIKVATLNVEQLTKESMTFLLKVGIAVYIYFQAGSLYDALAQSMNDMIEWVTQWFLTVGPSQCGLPVPPGPGFQVWQKFDCIFRGMFTAATTPQGGGILVLVGAALFTAILGATLVGILLLIFAVMAFVAMGRLVGRALYSVLLCYVGLAFMMILAPLIAPLLVFEGRYTKQIFDRWLGLLSSTIFQPVVVIAYLSFAAMVVDKFVEGDLQTCGAGVCSFKQIFSSINIEAQTKMRPGFSWSFKNDPSGSGYSNALSNFANAVGHWTNQALAMAVNFFFHIPFLDVPVHILMQVFYTLAAFLLTVLTMHQLLFRVQEIARSITQNVGLALVQEARMPMEGAVGSALRSAGAGMKSAAKATGKLVFSPVTAIGGGMRGISQGVQTFMRNNSLRD